MPTDDKSYDASTEGKAIRDDDFRLDSALLSRLALSEDDAQKAVELLNLTAAELDRAVVGLALSEADQERFALLRSAAKAREQKSARDNAESTARVALTGGDNRQALTVLMNAYGSEILGFCRHLVGDHMLAEEVLQDVFVDMFSALSQMNTATSFRAFLFGIARQRCLNALRARRRYKSKSVEIADNEPRSDAAAGPEEILQRRQLLDQILQTLDASERMLITLRYFHEMSYSEIAAVTGEKEDVLRQRLSRTVSRLTAAMGKPVVDRELRSHLDRPVQPISTQWRANVLKQVN